jgi:hypothetical protein
MYFPGLPIITHIRNPSFFQKPAYHTREEEEEEAQAHTLVVA